MKESGWRFFVNLRPTGGWKIYLPNTYGSLSPALSGFDTISPGRPQGPLKWYIGQALTYNVLTQCSHDSCANGPARLSYQDKPTNVHSSKILTIQQGESRYLSI